MSPQLAVGTPAIVRDFVQRTQFGLDIHSAQQLDEKAQRQTHHVQIAAFDVGYGRKVAVLDSVAARLVHRLASRDVLVDLFI